MSKGENQLVYPDRYDPYEVDRLGGGTTRLNHCSISMSGEIGRGGDEEFTFIVMRDDRALEYAADPDMMIVDSVTADAEMEQARINNGVPEEQINDSIVNAIMAKQTAGIPLTQANLDALDPDKPERGINRARKLSKDVVPEIDDNLSPIPRAKKEFQTKAK